MPRRNRPLRRRRCCAARGPTASSSPADRRAREAGPCACSTLTPPVIASTGAWILEPVDHYRQNVTGQHKLCRLPARAGHQTETIAETTLARSTIRRAGPGSIRSLSGWVEGTRTLNLRLMRPMPYLFWPRPKEWSAFPSIRSSTQKRGGPGGIRTHRLPILRRAHVPILLRGFWPAREESNLQRTELQPAALPLEATSRQTHDNLSGREDSNLRTPGSKPGSEPDPPPPRQIQEPSPGAQSQPQAPSHKKAKAHSLLVPRTGIEPAFSTSTG